MSTITDSATTATDEQLVTPREGSVLFMSRRRDLRLVKIPRYPRYAGGGRQVGEEPGEALQFIDGVLRVPVEGEIELEDGRQVEASEILQWLERHRRLGDVNEGFWRVDPTAPAPSSAELNAIMEAAIELDEEKLETLIAQEREGWERPAILEVAEGALERIRLAKAAATQPPTGGGAQS